MARRGFEGRSALQNKSEIVRPVEKFLGAFPDLTQNEQKPGQFAEMVNCLAYGDYCKPRDGYTDYSSAAADFPPLSYIGTGFMAITATKAGNTITFTGGSPSSADVGCVVVWADGGLDRILSYDCNSYVVDNTEPHTSTSAYVRKAINCSIYHSKRNRFVLHFGTKLYYVTGYAGGYAWFECFQNGETTLPNETTWMHIVDDYILILTTTGIFRLSLLTNTYWKCNITPGVNSLGWISFPTIIFLGDSRNGYWSPSQYHMNRKYTRRYTITQTRLYNAATARAFVNRLVSGTVIDQETGSQLKAETLYDNFFDPYQANSDTIDISTDNLTGGQNETYTTLLTATGSAANIASLVGGNFEFLLTLNGTQRRIEYYADAGTSWTQLLVILQIAVQQVFPGVTVARDPIGMVDKIEFFYPYTGAVIGFLAEVNPQTTGYTTVAALLKGRSADSATQPTRYVYDRKWIYRFSAWPECRAYTHWSIYGSEDSSEIYPKDLNDMVWLDDVPIVKNTGVLAVSLSGSTIVLTSGNSIFQTWDRGRVIALMWSGSPDVLYYARIAKVVSATVVNLYSDSGSLSSRNGTSCLCSVMGGRYVGTGYVCNNLLTISKTTGAVYDVNQYVNASYPSNHYLWSQNDMSALTVGSAICYKDGSICWITSITSDTTNYYLQTDSVPSVGLTGAVTWAAIPRTIAVTGYGLQQWDWADSYFDEYSNAEISARVGELGLKTRFWTALPSSPIGDIGNGYFMVASGNYFHYNDIPLNRTYLIGNYDAGHQQEKVNEQITAIKSQNGMYSIWTPVRPYRLTTNMQSTYTDPSTGAVTGVLPSPVPVSDSLGVLHQNHIISTKNGAVVCLNSDFGVRAFDGYSFGEDLAFNRIKKSLAVLGYFTLHFDPIYGIMVFASSSTGTATWKSYSDTLWILGAGAEHPMGSARFTDFPACGPYKRPYLYSNGSTQLRTIILNEVSRLSGASTKASDAYAYQVDNSTTDNTYAISGWFTTQADKGTTLHHYLRFLEGHLYLYPMTSFAGLTWDISAYNDFQTKLYDSYSAPYDGDLNYFFKITGHRIQFKYAFNKATWRASGLLHYYAAADKANQSRQQAEATYAAIQPDGFWLSRFYRSINSVTGTDANCTFVNAARATAAQSKDGYYGSSWALNNTGAAQQGYVSSTGISLTRDYAVMAWVYVDISEWPGTNRSQVVVTGTGGFNTKFYVWYESGQYKMGMKALGSPFATAVVAIAASGWYHFAWVINEVYAPGVDMYFGGVKQGPTVDISAKAEAITSVKIGGETTPTANVLLLLHDVRVQSASLFSAAWLTAYINDCANNSGNAFQPAIG